MAKTNYDLYSFEKDLYSKGYNFIAGVDEVGRGPLIGSVVTACVILPKGFSCPGLTDSKQLSEKKRDEFYKYIMENALGVGVGIKDERVIDEVNIYEATKLAMYEAIEKCSLKPEYVLIDAMKLENLSIPHESIIKGDAKSISIAAASVVAKVVRDRMMYDLDKEFPMYGLKDNKGYPTKKHIQAINEYGILKEHRKSFGPVKDYVNNNKDYKILN